MLRCQFLCYVLKTLFFIKIALKLSYFCNKMQKIVAKKCPQTPVLPAPIGLRRLEAPSPDPKISPPIMNFSLRAWFHFWWRPLFWSLPEFGEKKCSIFGEDLFFALHLIGSPEKNGGRISSPPMLKIGKNWGKIANYPPQCSTKICTPAYVIWGLGPPNPNFWLRLWE